MQESEVERDQGARVTAGSDCFVDFLRGLWSIAGWGGGGVRDAHFGRLSWR